MGLLWIPNECGDLVGCAETGFEDRGTDVTRRAGQKEPHKELPIILGRGNTPLWDLPDKCRLPEI